MRLRIEPDEPTQRSDPAEPIERIEPAEPIERMDPVEPTDMIEPVDAIDVIEPTEANESVDPSDATEFRFHLPVVMSSRPSDLCLGPAFAQATGELVGFGVDVLASTALHGGRARGHPDGSDAHDSRKTNPLPEPHGSLP